MRWILVGPRAAGKSTIGRMLSKKWDIPFCDLDDLIEEKSLKSPKQWIEENQEQVFRHWEAKLLKQWIEENSQGILATGGGAVLFPDTIQLLKKVGKVIWLRNSAKTRQKLQEKKPRPALMAGGLPKEIASADWSRNDLYRYVSDHSISTEGSTFEVIETFEVLKNSIL